MGGFKVQGKTLADIEQLMRDATALDRAGVAVRYQCHPGMIHLFYALGRLIPYAQVALARIGADIRTALS